MSLYEYRAELDRAVDGDTVDLRVDLGFRTYKNIRVRLEGVDTAEIYRPSDDEELELGREQKKFVEDFLDAEGDWPLTFNSEGESGKFGRWVGDISVNDESLVESLTEEYEVGT